MALIQRLVASYRDAFAGLPREVWLLSAATLVNRAGTMVLPFLTLYFTQRLELSASAAGMLMGLWGIGIAVLAMLVATVGEMLALPMANAAVADRAPDASTGAYMGAYTLAFATAFVLSPMAGLAVLDHLGGTVLWLGVGVTAAIAAAGFARLAGPFSGGRGRGTHADPGGVLIAP